jgi:hypothetical protein
VNKKRFFAACTGIKEEGKPSLKGQFWICPLRVPVAWHTHGNLSLTNDGKR